MRISNYFLPLIKESPSEAFVTSHKLMLKAGMIKQQSSGIYSWLPMGAKILKNVESIVRKNMDKIGCLEIIMPTIQPSNLWIESGRYDAYGDEMLRIKDRHDNDLLYTPTAEEMVTDIFRSHIKSYKELPKILYQIHWKFRDEIRPRFGVLRGREFLMKDAYSFDLNKDDAVKTYNKIFKAYLLSFKDMGLKVIPVKADSGPIGGDYSHEFHILADTGESSIFYDKNFENLYNDNYEISDEILEEIKSIYAVAEEKHKPEDCLIDQNDIVQKKGIEVGHIFLFGDKYTKPMNAFVTGDNGEKIYPECGSYGIGVSRVVAGIIEANHDDRGIIWPFEVAPYKFSLINLCGGDSEGEKISEKLYLTLSGRTEILYDCSGASAGSKFATHDLIGSPYQIIIGKKKIAEGMIELKNRKTGEVKDYSFDGLTQKIESLINAK